MDTAQAFCWTKPLRGVMHRGAETNYSAHSPLHSDGVILQHFVRTPQHESEHQRPVSSQPGPRHADCSHPPYTWPRQPYQAQCLSTPTSVLQRTPILGTHVADQTKRYATERIRQDVKQSVVFLTRRNHAQEPHFLGRFVFINSFANESDVNV